MKGKNQHRIITLDDCCNFAKLKNGKCLSKQYKNANTKIKWECEFGHTWEATYGNVYHKNKWCPSCYGNKKLNIDYCNGIANYYNGTCLSNTYINSQSKLKWKCSSNHIFEKSISAITSNNSWCPRCTSFYSEEICRLTLEKIFNTNFKKIRPKWLLNTNKNIMELDGYSSVKINGYHIAFEHNGLQHYYKDKNISDKNYFYYKDLKKRRQDDLLKLLLCNKHKTILIVIPQLNKKVKAQNLASFIMKELCNYGIDVSMFNFDIDICSIYREVFNK